MQEYIRITTNRRTKSNFAARHCR